jgi:hypothetical protein
MSMTHRLKPWQSDALIVVASLEGDENRATMERVQLAPCRECKRTVAACSKTIRDAQALPPHIRWGRGVDFLCVECFGLYDFTHVSYCEDHTGGVRRLIRS